MDMKASFFSHARISWIFFMKNQENTKTLDARAEKSPQHPQT